MHISSTFDAVYHTYPIHGVQLGCIELGQRTDQQPTLVLLHGFTGSASSWGSLLSHFATMGLHVIALDMLGHGRSSAPNDATRYSMEHCANDIIALLKSRHIDPKQAILLGYSMGGRIALYTALSGYFRALILESASAGLADPTAREQRRLSDNALADRIEREGLTAFVDYWEQLPLFASQHQLSTEQRNLLRAQRLSNSELGLANSLRGIGTGVQPALHERLAELTLPVCLITGAQDAKFCDIATTLRQHIPQSQHHIVQDAGHTIHLEQPVLFTALVQQFCTALA